MSSLDLEVFPRAVLSPACRTTLAHHITMRPSDDRSLVRDPAGLRRVARLLHRLGGSYGLVAFRVADTHLHVLVTLDRQASGRFAQRAQSSLKQALSLPTPFEPARHRSVLRRGHLESSIRYLARQEQHHGTHFDPAQEGSSLADLLGLRVIASEAMLVRARGLLPRFGREELWHWAGLEGVHRVEPDPGHLEQASAAVFALADLQGDRAVTRLARHAAVHAVRASSVDVARWLGVTPRAVQRLRRRPWPSSPRGARVLRAIELQLRLRTHLADGATTPLGSPLPVRQDAASPA